MILLEWLEVDCIIMNDVSLSCSAPCWNVNSYYMKLFYYPVTCVVGKLVIEFYSLSRAVGPNFDQRKK